VRIAITGSRGLVGSQLVPHWRAQRHEVVRIVRGSAAADEVLWDPGRGTIEVDKLHGVEAVVHLAGAGVGDRRWSPRYKEEILSSRVTGTTTLVQALAHLPVPPTVLVSASAVGYYGQRGDEVLTEEAGPGTGFLADVCARWEAATTAAATAGIRVVRLRTGVVLSAAGGALKKQLPLFRVGLGSRLGSGRQQLSWITPTRCGRCHLVSARARRPDGPGQPGFAGTGLQRPLHRGTGPGPASTGPLGGTGRRGAARAGP
jgi:uncharacterized protein (TIGR01777 family)